MSEPLDEHEPLDPDDLRSRLTFDYQTVMLMNSPLMKVEAYRNLDDLLAQVDPITSPTEGHLAAHYRVLYKIRTLTGPGRFSSSTTIRFDLFANINYPFEEPVCWVVDSETPWSPHFLEDHWVCIGKIWERAHGRILLAELIVHVAKLLNFDEPDYENPNYGGWRPDAVEYWETHLGRQPITKNLVYPQIPRRIPQPTEAKPETKVSMLRKTIEPPFTAIRIRPQVPADHTSRIKLRSQ